MIMTLWNLGISSEPSAVRCS